MYQRQLEGGAGPTGCHLQGLLATAAFEGSGRERRERNGGSHLRGSLSLLRKPGHSICEAFQRTLSSRVSPCFPQALACKCQSDQKI